MHIEYSQSGNRVTMSAALSDDDRSELGKAKMVSNEVTLDMPDGYDLQSTHPDLLALAALAAFSPWIGTRLTLTHKVSCEFSEQCLSYLKIKIPSTSDEIRPRIASPEARPGLSFSAGVDSFACLAIMPENTVPVFSHRSAASSKTANTLYRDDAPLHAIDQMNAAGKKTYRVTSNLEWLREPVGFGVDPAPAVPLILLADYFDLDAIAFGTIAEAAYRTGTEHFIDYAKRPVFTKWRGAFSAAGIDYYNCVAPLSELCTTKITRESQFSHLAQSCVRGLAGRPCKNCIKCFRKSIIEASFSGDWPERNELTRMLANRSIRNYLSTTPVRLEIVLAEALSRYDGKDPLLLALRERVAPEGSGFSFTQAWYQPGIESMVPKKYLQSTISFLNEYIPRMTPEQEREFETFDIRERVATLKEAGVIKSFLNALDENQKNFDSQKVRARE